MPISASSIFRIQNCVVVVMQSVIGVLRYGQYCCYYKLLSAHHVIYMQFVSWRFNSILDLNDALRGPTQGFVPRAHEQVNTVTRPCVRD